MISRFTGTCAATLRKNPTTSSDPSVQSLYTTGQVMAIDFCHMKLDFCHIRLDDVRAAWRIGTNLPRSQGTIQKKQIHPIPSADSKNFNFYLTFQQE
jgi:hypothetical protein